MGRISATFASESDILCVPFAMAQSRILIVEDELIVALELEDRLSRQGYAIVGTARSAEEALAILDDDPDREAQGPVDLALLDLRLAGARDGVELAQDLRERGIPFVFLTAHGDDETLARIKAVEPQGYLLKPFDERLLRLTIETALHRHAAERARLAAERAQRAAEAMQAIILEHSPDGVLVVDEEGSIELSNRAAQEIFDLPADSTPMLTDLLTGLSHHELRREHELHREGEAQTPRRVQARRCTGAEFPAEVAIGLAPTDDRERSIVIVRDVSRQAMLEQQLAHARQLEIAGRVASGVAHDLNNLLSVVWMTTYMLQKAPADELPALLGDLENAIGLGASLTARLLSMARRGGIEPREVVVNDALRAIARLTRRALSAGVELVMELDPQAGAIRIDPGQLDQLILNLALNADRAMPEGGRLTIRSRADEIEGEPVTVIEIADTGVGIDESIRRRVFEPFFSTRTDTGGTGLGLSIVQDVVEQAGGELEFESELGRGTRFRISFARERDADGDEALAAGSEAATLLGRGRTILLVDDDELHRRSMARLFEAKGFRPLDARGPGEALLMVERGHEPLALAVVDMEMPYMDGAELSERLKQLDRALPILLVSGTTSLLEDERRFADAALRKPLEPDSLFAEVTRLLAEPRSVH